jgi:hypothetical protein
LAQRASRALPTTLSTAREPLLSSMLLTLLVSALEGGCWALVGEEEREDFERILGVGGRERRGGLHEEEKGN